MRSLCRLIKIFKIPQLQQFGNLIGKSQKQRQNRYLYFSFVFIWNCFRLDFRLYQKHEQSHENHTTPDVLLWRGRARYLLHFTDKQEQSGIERRDMAITNNIPGEALWTRRRPPDSQRKLKSKCKGERKEEEEDTSKTDNSPGLACILHSNMAGLNQLCEPEPPLIFLTDIEMDARREQYISK